MDLGLFFRKKRKGVERREVGARRRKKEKSRFCSNKEKNWVCIKSAEACIQGGLAIQMQHIWRSAAAYTMFHQVKPFFAYIGFRREMCVYYMYNGHYFMPPNGHIHFLRMFLLVDEDWIEPDSWYVLFIRLKQSGSRGELCLPSTATSTHTVIITMETYALDQQA